MHAWDPNRSGGRPQTGHTPRGTPPLAQGSHRSIGDSRRLIAA